MRHGKILIACEESQAICIEFRQIGFEAYSCDIKPCSGGHPEWHIIGDAIEEAYSGKYDMMIGHPPCTYLSNVGNGYFSIKKYGPSAVKRWYNRIEAVDFFYKMWASPIEMICLENPIGFLCGDIVGLPHHQIIEPWYFGDPHKKRTALWLKNLPQLSYSVYDNLFGQKTATAEPKPIYIDKSGHARYFTDAISGTSKSKGGRQTQRSKTFPGIANAIAVQYGNYLLNLKSA